MTTTNLTHCPYCWSDRIDEHIDRESIAGASFACGVTAWADGERDDPTHACELIAAARILPTLDMTGAALHLGITLNTLRAYRFKRYNASHTTPFPDPGTYASGRVPLWSAAAIDEWNEDRASTKRDRLASIIPAHEDEPHD